MAVEVLSAPQQIDFAEDWYDIAGEDHFWLRWRFHLLLREITRLQLGKAEPWRGLDIGCGRGVVQRQLEQATTWRADGCDLNAPALAQHKGVAGRALYYDITERRPEFHDAYDFIVLFDVIEHVAETRPFISAALHHLKPGGYAFVNVPACQALYSRYDAVVGHCRRYDRPLLRRHLEEGGLEIVALRYWGLSLLPAALARKLYVARLGSTEQIVTSGFAPPGRWASTLLSSALATESIFPAPPIGTSLLAIARRPG
jgi:SAM-dependent methyltransferase